MDRRGRRRSVRRAVALECRAHSELWEGELALRVADLSEGGLWVATFRDLTVGQEVIVSLTPPLGSARERIWASTEVVHAGVRRSAARTPPERGVGLAIRYCSEEHQRLLAEALQRVPPRLPHEASAPARLDSRERVVRRRTSPPPLRRLPTSS